MKTDNRFPASFSIIAGIAGAIAWSAPYLIFQLLPTFPPYTPGTGIHVPLVEDMISFSLGWSLATGTFLLGIFTLSSKYKVRLGLTLSLSNVFAFLAGAAIGGAFASAIGSGIAYSPPVYFFVTFFDLQTMHPEPFLSIGFIFGAIIAASFISSFSNIFGESTISEESPIRITLSIVLIAFISALAGRIVISIFGEFFDYIIYLMDDLDLVIAILNSAIGGAVFGVLIWTFSTRSKAG